MRFHAYEVCSVIDERQRAGLMDESKLRNEAHGAANGSNQCIVRQLLRKLPVNIVGVVPVFGDSFVLSK